MNTSDNNTSIKAQEYNIPKCYSIFFKTDIKLQYGMYRLMEAKVRPIIYNAL